MFAALFDAAQWHKERFTAPGLCNLCWAAAVADQGQLAGRVKALSGHLASTAWPGAVAERQLGQLHRVHLWLLDRAPAGGGLAVALSADQLAQCATTSRQFQGQSSQQPRTQFELAIFACAQRLPSITGCTE